MKKEINEILGERVREQRKVQGYTRETFAEKIEVSTRFLADLESGKVGVSISTLKSIANNLNVSTDYLIGLKNPNDEEIQKEKAISKINQMPVKYIDKVNCILDCITEITKSEI